MSAAGAEPRDSGASMLIEIREAPRSKEDRDAMAACVAAWDEANEKKADAVEALVTRSDVGLPHDGGFVAKVELFVLGKTDPFTDACVNRTVLMIAPR